MATTVQWIFERAMALMDELSESTGSADTADTKEYKNRTLSILNILRIECFPFSDAYQITEPGRRPVCPELTDFSDTVGLDDGICQGVLPYGLAAHLLVDENAETAAFFQQRYEELLAMLRANLPAAMGAIDDLYGGIEHGRFGRW